MVSSADEELGIACPVGPPAETRKAETRKQKHDRRDALLLMRLLVENCFPAIWMPSIEQRDLRHLLLHRHQLVSLRSRVQHTLQSLALSHGLRRGPQLWNREGQQALAERPLAPHTARRRSRLQRLAQHVSKQVLELDQQAAAQASQRAAARLLMTHPGVGPVTALATEVFLGDPHRFANGKALAGYVGMIPQRILQRKPSSALGSVEQAG